MKRNGVTVIFVEYHMILKKYISRFVKRPQDIEDIVNEAFLKTYEAEISTELLFPKAYLFTTAKNLALKHIDKSSSRLVDYIADLSELEVMVDEISAERSAQSHEQFRSFCNAVGTLPLQCRKVFILRKIYGLSHKEIAGQLGISTSTVEKHLANGLLKCNEYMRSQCQEYLEQDSPNSHINLN